MLAKIVDTSDEWITTRTGIKVRNYVDDETTTFMAIEAARAAVNGIDTRKISVVIAATFTPDYASPHLSSIICSELGLPEEVTAFDLNGACSGFIYALNASKCMLQGGYALVVGSETISKVTDFSDRSSCILFGDGAGAVVIENAQNHPYRYVAGRVPGLDVISCKEHIRMNGKEVFRFAVDKICESIRAVMTDDVDYFVCHQANERILQAAAKKLDIDFGKFFVNIGHVGNTSAASIPIALDEMNGQGLLNPGTKLVLSGFGGGLSYGAIYTEV